MTVMAREPLLHTPIVKSILYTRLWQETRQNANRYNTTELFRAVKQNKLAAMLGVEGGHMIEDDIDKLDSYFIAEFGI